MNNSQCSGMIALTLLLSAGTTASAQQQFTRTINVDGLQREYLICLPVNFSESENMPVMMWHHGGGGTASGGLFEADFRSLANSERFIAVYAQAYPDVLEDCTCWGYEEAGGYTNGNYEMNVWIPLPAKAAQVAATSERTSCWASGFPRQKPLT